MSRFSSALPPAIRSAAGRCLALAAAGLFVAACNPASPSSSAPGGSPPAAGGSTSAPATNSGGGSVLFPYAVGDTWVYEETIGTTHGTATNKVIAVKPVAGGHQVTLRSQASIAGLPSTPTMLTYIFHNDGSITVPFAQVGNGEVSIKSGSIVWPSTAVLNSGQPHKSTLVLQIKSAALNTTVHAHVTVQGNGTQSVTVPAGTYQATVVKETIAEKVSGISVDTVVTTWLAPGVGPVKSQVVAGRPTATESSISQVLKSFTKG